MSGDEWNLRPIGRMRTCFGEKFAVPRQPGLVPEAGGELIFEPWCRNEEALRGLDGFSHLWLVFLFHQTAGKAWKPTVRPPRLGGNERIGVFASRSPFRPNPIGLSVVKLEQIRRGGPEGPVLELGGVDLVDGTPVLDVKPYLPYADAVPGAADGFAPSAPQKLPVGVAAAAAADFEALPSTDQATIREVLALDPRPAIHGDSDRIYGAKLCGRNVRFRISGSGCEITGIERFEIEDR